MVAKTIKEPRPKRTKSKAVAAPATETAAPTAETLALIAATVAKGIEIDPRLAVDYALKLWTCAREQLAGEIKAPAPAPAPVPKEPKTQKSDAVDPAPDLPSEPPAVSQPARDAQPESPPATLAVPTPKTALPTFDTFLRTVVKGETDADSQNRFRAFLLSKFPEPAADEQLARLSQGGFKDVGSWLDTTREYRDWCKSEKSS